MRRGFFAILTAAALQSGHRVDAEAPESIKIEALLIQLPEAEGIRVVPRLRSPATSSAAVGELLGMISKAQAKLDAWMVTRVRDGELGETQCVELLSYSCEFNPPAGPGSFGPTVSQTRPSRNESYDIPTTFESRYIGPMLSVRPTVSTVGIDVEVSLTRSELLGYARALPRQFTPHPNLPFSYDPPIFGVHTFTTQVSPRSGEWRLLGVFKPRTSPSELKLVILRATRPSAP